MNAAALTGEILADQEQRIKELEAENRELRAKLETVSEALTGAQNIVRELRDKDSGLPSLSESHHGQVAG